MSPENICQPERATQERVISLFQDQLGYKYLGDFTEGDGNSNIETQLLDANLAKRGYTPVQIAGTIEALQRAAGNNNHSLFERNKAVYQLLRYGIALRTEVSKVTETVKVIDWSNPNANDFAIAEEVTLHGIRTRRPDLVLYINGIAVGVIELKNSRTSIGDGIRQLLSNQQPNFNEWFFSTVQIVIAGNDSEGMQYGTIKTPEKFFLKWKEDEKENSHNKLDKYLLKMCDKSRLIELIHDFVIFDGKDKKLPRAHQYFGVKAAQERINQKKGGIIWHTQGSGKSIVMVLLAKWILENKPNARVIIVTDRDELDKQILGVFRDIGMSKEIKQASSGRELMDLLRTASPRLICSLVHKFGKKGVGNFEEFIEELKSQPVDTVGDLFVFVDECHRTQTGKLHKTMKALMPEAVFIGFTGTPLLKADKQTSHEVFGDYIHKYKFNEGVEDGVVLDLRYDAKKIDQELESQEKVDQWFDAKTRGLNDWKKAELRKQWGTMQKVLSSKSRMDRIVADIVFDFGVKPRLSNQRGNALLVASSIYDACKYYKLFQETELKGKCAVVTSYNPLAQDVTEEETGANTETDKQFIYNTYEELLRVVVPNQGKTKTETYEDEAKWMFTKQPGNMKLLVVVDKLLTGFDAPPCTYLYIDKSMQDHGLFQAICRVNRLDGEDKDYGYIVDYKDLFKKVGDTLAVYTSELDGDDGGGEDPAVLLGTRLAKGRERLDAAVEAMDLICEPVLRPAGELEYIHYFCGNIELPDDLQVREPQRAVFYKGVAGLVRAYANIADDLAAAGYNDDAIAVMKVNIEKFVGLRETIKRASGESIDLKAFEADMRHLIDTYIKADLPKQIAPFAGIPLLDLIVKSGIADAINSLPKGIRNSKEAVAETIANNVRSKIVKDHLNDPAFYDKMSSLLKEIIASLKRKAIEYEEYLLKVAALAAQVHAGHSGDLPKALVTSGLRALYNNLEKDEALALRVDEVVKDARPDDWRGNRPRENQIKAALLPVLGGNVAEVERIFAVIQQHREY